MVSIRPPGAVTSPRLLASMALLALAATIAACRSYVFMPIDVSYEKLSPPYVMSIVNQTGLPFEVLPSSSGRDKFPVVSVPPGQSFKAILQWRRFTVGAQSGVSGAQVVDNPYFEQAGADRAELRVLAQKDPGSVLISAAHPAWFAEYVRQDAAPLELVVRLREFSRAPLFPRGPQAGP